MLNSIVEFLKGGTFRRAATGISTSVAAVVVPWANQKFGWALSDEVIVAILSALILNAGAYIVQSSSNEKHARDAGVAAEQGVKTIDDALKVLTDKTAAVAAAPSAAPAVTTTTTTTLPGGLPSPRDL